MAHIPTNSLSIVFETEDEMLAELKNIKDVIETYGVLTYNDVADMFAMSTHFTYEKYGWTDVDLITTRLDISMRENDTFDTTYVIILPKPINL